MVLLIRSLSIELRNKMSTSKASKTAICKVEMKGSFPITIKHK